LIDSQFSESKRFQGLRYGTGITVAILYLSYLAYLIFQVINDEPLIQISYEYLDKLSIPGIYTLTVNNISIILTNAQFTKFACCFHKDIEICGDWSDIEISKCVFTWEDLSLTTFDGCNEPFSRQRRIGEIKHCYLYSSNDTYVYGNNETNPKGPWVKGIDFYFKIKNITAVTSKYLSVGTITVQLMDPSSNTFHFS
jgi:hypothetical protein